MQDVRRSGNPVPVRARVRTRKWPVRATKPDDSLIAPAQPVAPNERRLRDAVEGRPTQHAEPLPGGLPPQNRIVYDTVACRHEAEPILVLTRREGASFVLDPTSHRMHLRYQVLPASFPPFPAPSPANDSARVSLRWFMPYTTPANFPASYSLTNSFSPNTRMQFDSYAYTIPLHEYILHVQ